LTCRAETGSGSFFSRIDRARNQKNQPVLCSLEGSPFAACWKAEMVKAGITPERLLKR